MRKIKGIEESKIEGGKSKDKGRQKIKKKEKKKGREGKE